MPRRNHTSDRGASTTEYAAIVVLAAALVAGLLALNLPRLVSGEFGNATERVLSEEGTERGPGSEQDRGSDPADQSTPQAPEQNTETPAIPLGGESQIDDAFWDGHGGTPTEAWDFLTGGRPMFEFEYRGNYDWDCGYLLDGFCKLGGGISQGADETWEDIQGTGCQLLHACSHETFEEQWQETRDGFERLRDDPGGALSDMWDGFVEPFSENRENNGGIGGFFKNLGYSATQVAGGPLKLLRPFGGDRTPDGDGRDRDGSDCAPNSFPPGVLVLLADGTAVPIEQVSVGDQVLAADPHAGEQGEHEVTRLMTSGGTKTLVDVVVDEGPGGPASVTATDNHPFWVLERGWVDAIDLQPGSWLRTSSGAWAQISAVDAYTVPDQRVHNLTVNDLHTYYVLVGDTPILVHNADCVVDEIAQKIANHTNGEALRPDGNGTHYVKGVKPDDLAKYVAGVIGGDKPNVETRFLRNGRVAYWDPEKDAIVIEDGDGGTVFTPKEGKEYFDELR
ncbi:polymorphic toxin-type HINT domain-containing protein [Nocardiopsis aegyptia]|uniref:polymorphic toxin-type HINT domain-containing protein n=1 Tax=Nocardiopsis aegyptia TaxID=220378 RepID=UPI00366EC29F